MRNTDQKRKERTISNRMRNGIFLLHTFSPTEMLNQEKDSEYHFICMLYQDSNATPKKKNLRIGCIFR